jgi:hypothetical protein
MRSIERLFLEKDSTEDAVFKDGFSTNFIFAKACSAYQKIANFQ